MLFARAILLFIVVVVATCNVQFVGGSELVLFLKVDSTSPLSVERFNNILPHLLYIFILRHSHGMALMYKVPNCRALGYWYMF